MVNGKRPCIPVVARISMGRVDIPVPLTIGRSAAEPVLCEYDEGDSMIFN